MPKRSITFVAAVNDRGVLRENLLASPCLASPHPHEIMVQEGFASAGKAYNDAMDRSHNDLMIFAHQDVIFPENWLQQLEISLAFLEDTDPGWGVLGCYGETQEEGGRGWVFQPNLGLVGSHLDRPLPIQTLDEIVLILRKSSGLRFDEELPYFHLYGTDICLRARQAGRTSYAIPAFCIHNTNQGFFLPREFYRNYWQIRKTWRSELPIQSPCMRITRLNLDLYKRKLQEAYSRHLRRETIADIRVTDVAGLLRKAESIAGRPNGDQSSRAEIFISGEPEHSTK
jgi:hypothetical protein